MNYDLLLGDKVALREMRDDDLELLFDWENRPELDYLGNEHEPLTEAQLSHFINHSTGDIYTDGQLRLMIDIKDSSPSLHQKDELSTLSGQEDSLAALAMTVGCIDLFEFDPYNQRAGVGILIADNEHRKQGYAAESLSLLTNYCFEVLNFKQLYCHIPVDNEASVRLFTSLGFEQTGRCKDWVKKGNEFIDAVFMQKVR